MKRILFRPGAAVAVLLVTQVTWAATTIDFEAMTTSPDGSVNNTPYSEDGYFFSGGDIYGFEDGWASGRGSSNGTTNATRTTGSNQDFDFARIDAAPFALLSMDLAELVNNGDSSFGNVARQIDVTGTLDAGGTVQATLFMDLMSDGAGGIEDFETFIFGAEWINLASVNVATSADIGYLLNFDNIVVDSLAIPIPATAWLFGSALGLLGWMKRRHN